MYVEAITTQSSIHNLTPKKALLNNATGVPTTNTADEKGTLLPLAELILILNDLCNRQPNQGPTPESVRRPCD